MDADALLALKEGWPVLILVLWAEVRALPHLLDAIGWARAIGGKLGVTDADAIKARPSASLLRRAGTPIMLAAVVATLAGCVSSALRENVPPLRRAWSVFRDSSAPIAGVSSEAHARLAASIDRNLATVEEASRE